MRILLIESDNDLVEKIKPEMDKHFVVDVTYNGYDGSYMSQVNDYAAIVVDTAIPDTNILDLCKNTREAGVSAPLLVLSDTTDSSFLLSTLESGADFMLTKPVCSHDLLSMVHIMIQKSGNQQPLNLKAAGVILDIDQRSVVRDDTSITLRKKEFSILELLLLRKNKLVTREHLLDHIWEDGIALNSNTLDVHIKNLRDKLDKPFDKKLIKTIYGLGYMLQA